MNFTKEQLEQGWTEATGMDATGPLHAAIINEVVEALEGEEMTADTVGGVLQQIVDDCQDFARVLRIAERDSKREQAVASG